MPEQQDITLGEVYRLCQSIDHKVEKQNGRVGKIEDRCDALEKDAIRIKTIWAAAIVLVGFFIDSVKHKLGMP